MTKLDMKSKPRVYLLCNTLITAIKQITFFYKFIGICTKSDCCELDKYIDKPKGSLSTDKISIIKKIIFAVVKIILIDFFICKNYFYR